MDSNIKSLSQKPNIVLIVLDHVTFRHYKMTKGARPVLGTYERLASKGVEFTNCHSVHPLCLPARASMLTGVYSHKHGKIRNDEQRESSFPLITEFLGKLGYSMAYFGKNHSGYELDKYGFEGFYPKGYGNPYLSIEYKNYLNKHGLENPVYCQEWGIHTGKKLYANGDYDLTQENNFNTYSAGYLKTPGPVHEADFLVSLASEWLDGHDKEKEPFLLRVDIWGPHHAYQVPPEFKDTINAEEIEEYPNFKDEVKNKAGFVRNFFAEIKGRHQIKTWKEWQPIMQRAYEHYSFIDNAVGKLIDKLEKDGLIDNTIIIYTADHGDALGSHGGMVDKAGDLMEEVMHIPMVVCGPGFKENVKSDKLVSNLDIVPTILDLAGIAPPEYMDGISMAKILEDDCSQEREDFMVEHYGHFEAHEVQRALYYKSYKYIVTENDADELYDLENDPFESDNLASKPEMKGVLYEMRQRLLDYMNKHDDKDIEI